MNRNDKPLFNSEQDNEIEMVTDDSRQGQNDSDGCESSCHVSTDQESTGQISKGAANNPSLSASLKWQSHYPIVKEYNISTLAEFQIDKSIAHMMNETFQMAKSVASTTSRNSEGSGSPQDNAESYIRSAVRSLTGMVADKQFFNTNDAVLLLADLATDILKVRTMLLQRQQSGTTPEGQDIHNPRESVVDEKQGDNQRDESDNGRQAFLVRRMTTGS